ncbi:Protein of unknown function [Bacillus mycoides]|uniref:Uncharacterized protein n=1 Tax=Bacillus mycoides TaxID=1405 RepID=A0A1C4CNK9_BACMY|nr:Protein of unknown function [Bacillus mycoides]SCC20686.1 Protein of unknown function [Bacillus mycoides]
MIMNGEEDA